MAYWEAPRGPALSLFLMDPDGAVRGIKEVMYRFEGGKLARIDSERKP